MYNPKNISEAPKERILAELLTTNAKLQLCRSKQRSNTKIKKLQETIAQQNRIIQKRDKQLMNGAYPDCVTKCVICWTGIRRVVFKSCGHCTYCLTCHEKTEHPDECPICRSKGEWCTLYLS